MHHHQWVILIGILDIIRNVEDIVAAAEILTDHGSIEYALCMLSPMANLTHLDLMLLSAGRADRGDSALFVIFVTILTIVGFGGVVTIGHFDFGVEPWQGRVDGVSKGRR